VRLAHGSIRQLRQRITFQHHIRHLTRDETSITSLTGSRSPAIRATRCLRRQPEGDFSARAAGSRLVNILAHKALMLAYGEGVQG